MIISQKLQTAINQIAPAARELSYEEFIEIASNLRAFKDRDYRLTKDRSGIENNYAGWNENARWTTVVVLPCTLSYSVNTILTPNFVELAPALSFKHLTKEDLIADELRRWKGEILRLSLEECVIEIEPPNWLQNTDKFYCLASEYYDQVFPYAEKLIDLAPVVNV